METLVEIQLLLVFVGKLGLKGSGLRRGGQSTIMSFICHRVTTLLGLFLSLFRIIQQHFCACSSSGIMWIETMASPPAAGAATPPLLSVVFPG